MTAQLDLRGVTKVFGALRAVDGVSLTLPQGARHALIGPNGAGKSTLLQLITGHLRADSGQVCFRGEDITRLGEFRRAGRGVTQTFQHSHLFTSMTVVDNIVLSLHRDRSRREIMAPRSWKRLTAEALDIAARVGLVDQAWEAVESLSHGQRRQLEVGVAVARRPRLLLLDEPAAGMSPHESARLADLIRSLPAEMTILFVEHDLDLVFELAETVTVLHLGQVLADGSTAAVRELDAVQEAYLGGSHSEDLFLPAADSGV